MTNNDTRRGAPGTTGDHNPVETHGNGGGLDPHRARFRTWFDLTRRAVRRYRRDGVGMTLEVGVRADDEGAWVYAAFRDADGEISSVLEIPAP